MKIRLQLPVKTGPPQAKKGKTMKKNAPPPDPISEDESHWSFSPLIPAKWKKNKATIVSGPTTGSQPAATGPTHRPVFFSDHEDVEHDERTQRDLGVLSNDDEDYQRFLKCNKHNTKQKGVDWIRNQRERKRRTSMKTMKNRRIPRMTRKVKMKMTKGTTWSRRGQGFDIPPDKGTNQTLNPVMAALNGTRCVSHRIPTNCVGHVMNAGGWSRNVSIW